MLEGGVDILDSFLGPTLHLAIGRKSIGMPRPYKASPGGLEGIEAAVFRNAKDVVVAGVGVHEEIKFRALQYESVASELL